MDLWWASGDISLCPCCRCVQTSPSSLASTIIHFSCHTLAVDMIEWVWLDILYVFHVVYVVILYSSTHLIRWLLKIRWDVHWNK